MKEQLFREPTEKTPFLLFDSSKEKFEIIGVSMPPDARSFYQPALEWLEEYVKAPLEETNFVINLDYFNTSSSKMILLLLHRLQEIGKLNKKVTINWFYNDEDLLEAGKDYEYITKLKFEYIEVSKDFLVR